MNELTNIASASGTYNSLVTTITSNEVVTPLISGLTITKTADKVSWADGTLTYTIVVSNQAELSYENPIITDIIDVTKTTFVNGSVYINDTQATSTEYTYDSETGTLTINLQTLATTQSSTVTFQVTKAA